MAVVGVLADNKNGVSGLPFDIQCSVFDIFEISNTKHQTPNIEGRRNTRALPWQPLRRFVQNARHAGGFHSVFEALGNVEAGMKTTESKCIISHFFWM